MTGPATISPATTRGYDALMATLVAARPDPGYDLRVRAAIQRNIDAAETAPATKGRAS